ncbi:MAG: hypothetical protein A3I31_00500 [Candidatus Colwellbacteria bacterium RIFCSPLOWO2_02_FULL_44_20b]|uniref:phosphoglycerate mutase (2,3-diphosphoglycerate-dependent) n=1 Tax=Candidatus Colwellbacteria bacterium RIFCSPLOWO2_02_FULL_44_20b TaxID=1797691 RepID=A0A1G1Z4S8_9BACT|nr:MAG: hypothetical protein A3I31_00500 [Candidatus Colwellbacteria bacterium RIFCSPLOWO2_02_FULL_44_20b]
MRQIIQKWPNYLILVRHGQSVYNEERELVNRGVIETYTKNVKEVRSADLPLSELGKLQAEKTGLYLKEHFPRINLILSSPFERAYDTARIIAKHFPETRFVLEERVREKEYGITEALTPAELKSLFPYEYERKQKEEKYYYRPPGGESSPDVNLRIWSFLTTLVREHAKMNVLVVTHSVVMLSFRKLLEKFSEQQLSKIDREDALKNCAIISYRFDRDLKPKPKLKLEFYNKVA